MLTIFMFKNRGEISNFNTSLDLKTKKKRRRRISVQNISRKILETSIILNDNFTDDLGTNKYLLI